MRKHKRIRKGIALFIAMVFVVIFSAISVGMFNMSSKNTIVASNLHQANKARASAESGLEVVRNFIAQVAIPGLTPAENRFEEMATQLLSIANNSFERQLTYDHLASTEPHIHIGHSFNPIAVSDKGSFYARIADDNNGGFEIEIIGQVGNITRTIHTGFTYGVRKNNVFDFGVATKGPLSLQGNILLDGFKFAVESDVYIESLSQDNALEIIGNSQIAGDVKIVNPDGTVTLQGGQASIGGETGADAIENHVDVGVPETEFPIPNTSHFEQYVTGDTIDSSTVVTNDMVLENVRIAAGTNPHFSSNVQILGILYIETPNVVTFTGNVDIAGLIVGDGDVTDNSGVNQINITGNVSSQSVDTKALDDEGNEVYVLNDSKFDGLRDETGTFMMTPGFKVDLGGSFDTLNGCIAANGVSFSGNAGGIIGGSVLNYSTDIMEMSGNSDLIFNRSGITEVPAGFVPEIVIHYNSSAYSEVALMN